MRGPSSLIGEARINISTAFAYKARLPMSVICTAHLPVAIKLFRFSLIITSGCKH
jgi:hypothetical protein